MEAINETILIYTILAGILSIIYGFFTGKNILNASSGNQKMQEIQKSWKIDLQTTYRHVD